MQDSRLTFTEYVTELTEDHPVMVDRDGELEVRWEGAMIPRLRDSIVQGRGASGGGGRSGSHTPLDDAALDLLQLVTDQAKAALTFTTGKTPARDLDTEDYVRAWAGTTNETTVYEVGTPTMSKSGDVFTAIRNMSAVELAGAWHAAIKGFFSPPSTEAIDAPCPRCEQRRVHRWQGDELIETDALAIYKDRDSGRVLFARCGGCDAEWERAELVELALQTGLFHNAATPA